VVGTFCRDRVADKERALDRQAALLRDKAIGDAGRALDDKIETFRAERMNLGAAPQDADPTAHRLAKAISLFHDLGSKGAERVAEWWPTWTGLGVEAIDLLGPLILVGWLVPAPAPERRWWSEMLSAISRRRRPTPAVAAPSQEAAPAPKTAAPAQTPATPAKAKKVNKSTGKQVQEFGDMREWYKSRTASRTGNKVKPADAYAAYKDWCNEQGREHVSLTAFGTTMKAPIAEGGCGVNYYEKPNSKRGFYMDIALVAAPKLAVVR
jgi:hypothetical protein